MMTETEAVLRELGAIRAPGELPRRVQPYLRLVFSRERDERGRTTAKMDNHRASKAHPRRIRVPPRTWRIRV